MIHDHYDPQADSIGSWEDAISAIRERHKATKRETSWLGHLLMGGAAAIGIALIATLAFG